MSLVATRDGKESLLNNDGVAIDTKLCEMAKELGQFNLYGLTRRIVASIVLQGSNQNEEEEEEEEDDDDNDVGLPVVLEEQYGFIFVQSIGTELWRKTRIRPGQLVIRLNNVWFQYGDSLLQQQGNNDNNHWKEWWSQHGTKKNERLVMETVEGWGAPTTRVTTHLIQVEKSPSPQDEDNDGDNDNTNNDHLPIPLGLSFQKQGCGHIWLTRISPTGLFHQALYGSDNNNNTTTTTNNHHGNLPLPSSVILVNGVPCPQSTPEVIKQLSDTSPMVSIECRELGSPSAPVASPCPPATTTTATTATSTITAAAAAMTTTTTIMEPVVDQILTVILEKPTATTPLGISLRKSVAANSIFIAGLAPHSLSTTARSTTISNQHAQQPVPQLEVGQKLLQINGQPCPSSTAATVQRLQQLQGRVELQVATIDWSRTLAISAVAATTAITSEIEEKPSATTSPMDSQNSNGSLLVTRLQSYLVSNKESSPL